MSRNAVETLMGALVLTVAGGFLFVAYQSSGMKPATGTTISAKFDSVDGLAVGGDVRIGGIKVGAITGQTLDPATYSAIVTFSVAKDVPVPVDSTAAIVSDGLLGGKYLSISPGGDDKNLGDGGEIKFTQSAVNLETLIGKFMFSGGGVDGNKKQGEGAAPETPAPALAPTEAAPSKL